MARRLLYALFSSALEGHRQDCFKFILTLPVNLTFMEYLGIEVCRERMDNGQEILDAEING